MDPTIAQTIAAIGPRLRRLRTARGLTLAQVADRSGVSLSLLSRVETGKRQPTLDVLLPLAASYRVSLDRLIAAPDTAESGAALQPRSFAGGGVVVPLTQHAGNVQVFKQVLDPREVQLVRHQGRAWLYVLAGSLRLLLEDEEYLLAPGETAQFDASIPHWFGPAGAHPVELLHLFGPHGAQPVTRLVRNAS